MSMRGAVDVLAIVGSTAFVDVTALAAAERIVEGVFARRRPDLVVSGGAEGIDRLGVRLARSHGIKVDEYLPQHRRWKPQGFQERNDRIADNCTRLLRVACRWSRTYGSGYTHDRAVAQGKQCWSVLLPTNLHDGTIEVDYQPATPLRLRVQDGVVVEPGAYVRRLGWLGQDADDLVGQLKKMAYPVRWNPLG